MSKNGLIIQDEIESIVKTLMLKGQILYHANIEVQSHVVKKNGRNIKVSKRLTKSGKKRMFPGKSGKLIGAENWMRLNLPKLKTPITSDIWAIFHFYFEDYYTKGGVRSKNLPDLSNLYELPQDIMQSIGVYENDTQICSHDLSRRLPGLQNRLEIFLLKFSDKP